MTIIFQVQYETGTGTGFMMSTFTCLGYKLFIDSQDVIYFENAQHEIACKIINSSAND